MENGPLLFDSPVSRKGDTCFNIATYRIMAQRDPYCHVNVGPNATLDVVVFILTRVLHSFFLINLICLTNLFNLM